MMKTLVVLLLSAMLVLSPVSAVFAQMISSMPNFVVMAATWGSMGSPMMASPGKYNLPLVVELVNEGGIAVNASATLKLWGPFYFLYFADGKPHCSRDEVVRLGTVPAGGQAMATFYVSIKDHALDGVYVIPLTVTSKGFNQTLNVSVPLMGYASVKVIGIGYNPPVIFPGEQDVELQAYVANVGISVGQNATAWLVLPTGFSPAWGNSTVHEIGALPVGTEIPMQFYFDVGSVRSPANYTARILITWADGNESVPVTIMVQGKASFSVVSVLGHSLTQGGSGQKLYVTVENTGNFTAHYVTFNLIVPNEFSGVTTDYVGSLKPGQRDVVRFELDTASSALPMLYNFTLQVTWYQNNSEVPFTSYLPIQVRVKQSLINSLWKDITSAQVGSSVLPFAFIAVIVFLVGLLIGVLTRRGKAEGKG
mgnify:CR=1 FL=1